MLRKIWNTTKYSLFSIYMVVAFLKTLLYNETVGKYLFNVIVELVSKPRTLYTGFSFTGMSSRIFERLARYEKTLCIARSQAALLPNHCKPVARTQLLWHRYVMFPKRPCGQSWFCSLCWLILCVNLIGLRDTQIAGKKLFLGVSMTVFLEEMSIWSSRLRKRSALLSVGG